ncbi:MAG: ATP-binding protein [Bacteroidales bacterium]|nr:ATP-binding protein [Bacteroidales bacterium]
MEIPFTYGKIVADNDFTDRVEETQKLVSNLLSGTSTSIISPRRWGKSSLVNRALERVSEANPSILIVKINAFKCETPQEFYDLFAKRTVECISTSAETLLANAREFVSKLLPKIMVADPASQYSVSFGVDMKSNPIEEDILDLPQQVATRRGRKVIVCIDEFQQIGQFAEGKKFQKILRGHWQEHPDVTYVLYGSQKHMMLDIFGEYRSPFYKFGDMLFLPKISNKDWVSYIRTRFTDTGKVVSEQVASRIANLVENHSYYVQQLSQYAWLRSETECTDQVVTDAFQALLDSLNLQFINLMDRLTEKQRSFLCAVSDGVKAFSSMDTLQKYSLGSSANIRIIKAALLKKDLIDISAGKVEIQDPVFNKWIQKVYKNL